MDTNIYLVNIEKKYLTYEEVICQPGVYKCMTVDASIALFVVNQYKQMFYIRCLDKRFEIANSDAWEQSKFIKYNKRVVVTFE